MLQHWVLSYDMADARNRQRVATLLLDHGERVQESVFELRLHPQAWAALCDQLNRLMNPQTDQWRAWPLCASDRADRIELGLPSPHPPERAVVV